jgi:hypothetical protein
MKTLAWLSILMASVLLGHAQGSLRSITFEGPPTVRPDWIIGATWYEEGEMWFMPARPSDAFSRAGGQADGFPQNGSAYLIFGLGDSLRGVMANGESFGLFSVDLAEFSTLYQFPQAVPFIGYRVDGSSVTNTFTTDGVTDSSGSQVDFQTFHFDSQFSDIVRFELPSYLYALDNLVISIPEPAVSPLLIVGTMLAFLSRRRPRRPPLR